jgi:ribose/xylose/arabinose/galactoside ABC-type transport system permease subunit
VKPLWRAREASTIAILVLEVLFFAWYLWPEGLDVGAFLGHGGHPFFNHSNFLLIFKYSSIYGIAAIGAAIVIITGGVDLSPGSVIALTSVITGYCFVEAGWPLGASAAAGLATGLVAGLVSSWLVVSVKLPPFIATLGVMGIWRGLGFIITEARFYDLSASLPRDWRVAGVSVDWAGPIVMIVLAAAFQILMTRFQWGRAVFAVGGNETAALFSGIRIGRIKTSAYVLAGLLASVSGVVLAIVQGQGKADLATGYELDIIASAVVGGASLSGGRGSVLGAVLGALIFGVLRNALPQIPGATFYDRLIVGLAVIVIVVMDQVLVRRERT